MGPLVYVLYVLSLSMYVLGGTVLTEEDSVEETSLGMLKHHKKVAFHAVSDRGEIAHLGIGQTIVFETVLLNIGNGYNVHHGIFTAPVSGLYMIAASILSFNGKSNSLIVADVVKNGDVMTRLYGHGVNGHHAQGSSTFVTHLDVNDHVWVRVYCCPNGSLYGYRYTTFSGALIA